MPPGNGNNDEDDGDNPFAALRRFINSEVLAVFSAAESIRPHVFNLRPHIERSLEDLERDHRAAWKRFGESYERSTNPERRTIEPRTGTKEEAERAAREREILRRDGLERVESIWPSSHWGWPSGESRDREPLEKATTEIKREEPSRDMTPWSWFNNADGKEKTQGEETQTGDQRPEQHPFDDFFKRDGASDWNPFSRTFPREPTEASAFWSSMWERFGVPDEGQDPFSGAWKPSDRYLTRSAYSPLRLEAEGCTAQMPDEHWRKAFEDLLLARTSDGMTTHQDPTFSSSQKFQLRDQPAGKAAWIEYMKRRGLVTPSTDLPRKVDEHISDDASQKSCYQEIESVQGLSFEDKNEILQLVKSLEEPVKQSAGVSDLTDMLKAYDAFRVSPRGRDELEDNSLAHNHPGAVEDESKLSREDIANVVDFVGALLYGPLEQESELPQHMKESDVKSMRRTKRTAESEAESEAETRARCAAGRTAREPPDTDTRLNDQQIELSPDQVQSIADYVELFYKDRSPEQKADYFRELQESTLESNKAGRQFLNIREDREEEKFRIEQDAATVAAQTMSTPDTELELYEQFLSQFQELQTPGQDGQKPSIISELTTTERRVSPDGTLTTKTVLKRRFADGTESCEEMENVQQTSSKSGGRVADQAMKIQGPVTKAIEEKEKTGGTRGWFWSSE